MQDHALPLGRDEKANRLDVGQRDFIEIQDCWDTTRGNFRAHMSNVFRPHATDQTNRCPVFIDVRDDPESHERGPAKPRGDGAIGRPAAIAMPPMTYRNVTC